MADYHTFKVSFFIMFPETTKASDRSGRLSMFPPTLPISWQDDSKRKDPDGLMRDRSQSGINVTNNHNFSYITFLPSLRYALRWRVKSVEHLFWHFLRVGYLLVIGGLLTLVLVIPFAGKIAAGRT